ncbi:MAG: ABC transporter [Arcobacter sp.]|nr:ABC transporter [Arcobacter sp.]|tara:strand:- start:11813 stop:12976 length:1164 start_codon:yes stop_codon:yes gene_type:complete
MFKYILKKEFLLIFRDIHALLVLFIMPALFILIMSLALKDTYSNTSDVKLKVALVSQENKDIKLLVKNLNKNNYFSSQLIQSDDNKKLIYENDFDFVIQINKDFKNQINTNNKDFSIKTFSKPDISKQSKQLIENKLVEAISQQIMKDFFVKAKINAKTLATLNSKISSNYIYKNETFKTKPNSVQQSVPAWLVFSMFFILIPISNTFINEKEFGTISRIRSIDVSMLPLLLGKIIPYFVVNQIQVIIMILIGIFVVPLAGGDSLEINGNYFLIFAMSSSISIAAICFALFIANAAKTTEEATSIGGVSNIVLAALGGIMVPKFVMPQFMQDISEYSPMAWGLEGLLEILVRGGSFNDIKFYILYLLLFASICFIIAYILLIKKEKR